MKSRTSITSMLGLTQEEMARLLKVSRSLWSLHELGKRDLPVHAREKLAELLSQVDNRRTIPVDPSRARATKIKMLQLLERMLRENEFQQVITERELTAVINRQDSATKLSLLAEYLNSRPSDDISRKAMVKVIMGRASQAAKSEDLEALIRLRIRKDVLELEKLLLDQKVRNVEKDRDEIFPK